jgi:hypothetical protein
MGEAVSPKVFLGMVGNALLRILALAVFGVAHWLLDLGSVYLVPENLKEGRLWLQDIAFSGFALVYAFMLWEMICIFAPWTKAKSS